MKLLYMIVSILHFGASRNDTEWELKGDFSHKKYTHLEKRFSVRLFYNGIPLYARSMSVYIHVHVHTCLSVCLYYMYNMHTMYMLVCM